MAWVPVLLALLVAGGLWLFFKRVFRRWDRSLKEGRRMIVRKAESGDPVAQFQRGRMYQEGEGEQRDSELADEWFHKAVPGLKKEAQDGGREAAFCLYECFRKGLGVEKDDARALFWLQRAAEQGEPVAMFTLALEYREGGLVQKDDDLFMYWLRRAAEEGNEEDAQYLLASCYEHGNGVPQDVNLARKWYDRAEHQRVSGSGAPRERTKGE